MSIFGLTQARGPLPTVVASWVVGQREVSVRKENDRLKFSVKNGDVYERQDELISKELYSTLRAEALIKMFRNVIQNNLLNGISQHSFLPILCREVWVLQDDRYVPTHFQAALFGRVVFDTPDGTIVGARWGVCNPSNREVVQIDLDDIPNPVQTFIKKAFGAREADYNVYAREVKPVMTRGDDGRVQSIALRHFSLFDGSVLLDENNWAITLVTTNNPGVGSYSVRGSNHGHAMIAYEGVENCLQFRRFAHITQDDRVRREPDVGRNPFTKVRIAILKFLRFAHIIQNDRIRGESDVGRNRLTQARVEILDKDPRSSLSLGPTWSRTRNLVEAMILPIQEAEKNSCYVEFGKMRDVAQASTLLGRKVARAVAIGSLVVGGGVVVIGTLVLIGGGVAVLVTAPVATVPVVLSSAALIAAAPAVAPQVAIIATSIFAIEGVVLALFALTSGATAVDNKLEDVHQDLDRVVNCISWCERQLLNAGIKITVPSTRITPLAVVNYLRAHSEAVVLN